MTEPMPDPAGRERILAGIAPADAASHHDLLRRLFRAEIEHRRATGGDEHYENLYWCAFLLHLVGDPADVPLMWTAKHLDFDTAAGFDPEFLLGAGVQPTLAYLGATGHADIAAELATLVDPADDLRAWREFRRGYFYPA